MNKGNGIDGDICNATFDLVNMALRPLEFGGDMGTKSVTNAIAEASLYPLPEL